MLNEETLSRFLCQSVAEVATIAPQYTKNFKGSFSRQSNGWQWSESSKQMICRLTEQNFGSRLSSLEETSADLENDISLAAISHQILEDKKPYLQITMQPKNVLLRFLVDYLFELDVLAPDVELSKKMANEFLESLASRTSGTVYFCIVRGLQCDFEREHFSSTLCLRKLNDNEIRKLIEREKDVLEEDILIGNEWVLEHTSNIPFSLQPAQMKDAVVNIDQVITALRLLKDGQVERGDVHRRKTLPGQFIHPSGYLGKTNPRRTINRSYDLLSGEVPKLKGILSFTAGSSLHKRIGIAIDRVDFAAERQRAEDKLLDLLIAMEAIFGDTQGAIGYKIGMRCAIFIEQEPQRRQDLRKLINVAYEMRSALVHGGKGIESTANHQLTSDLMGVIRKSIHSIGEMILSGKLLPDAEYFDSLLIGKPPQ